MDLGSDDVVGGFEIGVVVDFADDPLVLLLGEFCSGISVGGLGALKRGPRIESVSVG